MREVYTAFLSHFKTEGATEARWLQERLEVQLQGLVFLGARSPRNKHAPQAHATHACRLVIL